MRHYIRLACIFLLPCAAAFLGSGCSIVHQAATYRYRVVNENCNCEEYTVRDDAYKIEYQFHATYTMDEGVFTNIEIVFTSRGEDTLYFDRGSVKISSRNISYQYNDKFLPMPNLKIPPDGTDVVHLTGTDINDQKDWRKIAGEWMTVTIKGLRAGTREVPPRTVTFVPENPKLRD